MNTVTCIEIPACLVKTGNVLVNHGKTNKMITSKISGMPESERVTLRFHGGEVTYDARQMVLVQSS